MDRIAADFGQKCFEVPVGFKYISAKMVETDAIIGGESSGGLAVKGHISGKDGIYAAALLVEMLAVSGKSVGQLCQEIAEKYGCLHYAEKDCELTAEHKQLLYKRIFENQVIPAFSQDVERIQWNDGCKICFSDGSWVICRFSGTEPLLRIAAEGNTADQV
jgi:phosphomannomutase